MNIVYKQCDSVESREEELRDTFTDILGKDIVEKLIEKGFCNAPASTKYHGAYAGGLFDHSLYVAATLCDLTEKLNLRWENPKSPAIVGLLHDLCKIDCYNDIGDDFEGSIYEHVTTLVKGHSYKSVIYIQDLGVKLTEEEMLCILYHMGAYETDNWREFDKAIKKYPNVLYTHMSDMIASKIGGI